jgi:hypothetical protein
MLQLFKKSKYRARHVPRLQPAFCRMIAGTESVRTRAPVLSQASVPRARMWRDEQAVLNRSPPDGVSRPGTAKRGTCEQHRLLGRRRGGRDHRPATLSPLRVLAPPRMVSCRSQARPRKHDEAIRRPMRRGRNRQDASNAETPSGPPRSITLETRRDTARVTPF